jgi:tetratricopeptide (TPR) repeat protein
VSGDLRAGQGPGESCGGHGAGLVAGLQVGSGNVQVNHFHASRGRAGDGGALSTQAPAVPRAVHGRDDVVGRLVEKAGARCRCGPQVLAGAGGMGKSTIAKLVAARVRDGGARRCAWWVSAASEEVLSGGLISVARDLGASTADQEALRSHAVAGLGDVADRVWRLLDHLPSRWLLVIDNADDPSLLGPCDGTGWVRSAGNGLLVITTRHGGDACWPEADLITVGPLSPGAAAGVLAELAPGADGREAAAALAVRLGCLPLALRAAGTYLRQDFTAWRTFDEYRRALDAEGVAMVTGASGVPDHGKVVARTWELSLDALARSGSPQSRPLMWLLSCFAPGVPVPEELITATGPHAPLATLPGMGGQGTGRQLAESCMAGLRGLRDAGLIQRAAPADGPAGIEVHPFICEVTRSVLGASDPARTGIDPRLVRECAVTAVQAALSRLDPGSAADWPSFRALTPHVIDLLASTARHLGMRQRRALLNGLVLCIASYIWSRAEPRAEQIAVSGLELASRLAAGREPVYQRLRHVHALSLREQGRLAEAEARFREILAELTRLPGGATREDTLYARHDLAWTTGRQGGWAAAEQQFRDVLRLRRERRQRGGHQDDDADIMHTRCMMCWSIGKQGRWAEAEHDYLQLTADRAALLGPAHPDTLDTRENIGKCLAWQGKWAQAKDEWARLAALRTTALGARNPDTLRTRQLAAYATGLLARQSGNRATRRRATTDLREILRTQTDVRGDDHQETRETRALLTGLDGRIRPRSTWPEDLPQPPPRHSRTPKIHAYRPLRRSTHDEP